MQYPCNYGFIPHTLSGDGDPVDVLVYTNYPIAIKSVIAVKPIGVLLTEDEKGLDEKILAVPTNKIDPYFKNINNYTDLPEILIKKIAHFFERYKDLESDSVKNSFALSASINASSQSSAPSIPIK
jgi:inorganic pyrophosphatase